MTIIRIRRNMNRMDPLDDIDMGIMAANVNSIRTVLSLFRLLPLMLKIIRKKKILYKPHMLIRLLRGYRYDIIEISLSV